MIAVHKILLGTFLLLATFFNEGAAEDVSGYVPSQTASSSTSPFERFRPVSNYSASGKGTAAGPNSRYQANRQHAKSQSLSAKGTHGLRRPTTTFVQHDLKPTLKNELRIAPKTFQALDDSETSVPDFEAVQQTATETKSPSDDDSEKQPAEPSVDPLIEKLNQALSNRPTKSNEPELKNEPSKGQTALMSAPQFENTQASLPPAEEALLANDSGSRKLGFSSAAVNTSADRAKSPFNEMLAWRPSTNSLVTMGSGLAIVLGLVMIVGWVARKSMPRSARVLPNEVAEVLGRVVLSSRQTAQLLKLGNKLILVSVTADGAETLTEIEDPEEVQRLLQLSEEASGRGSNAEFERVFQQLANGPAADSFLGEDAPAYDDPRFQQDPRQQNPDNVHYDAQRLAAAYANTPGGRSHAA